MGIGIHFDKDDEDDGPLFGRHWRDENKDDYDKPLLGRNWLEDMKNRDERPLLGRNWLEDIETAGLGFDEPIYQPEEEDTESITHPKDVRVGDKLKVLYKNELITVTVINEPFEIEELGPDDKGWWQCMIMYKPYLNDYFVVWTEENPVWELGE